MRFSFLFFFFNIVFSSVQSQNVGVSTVSPLTKLDIRGLAQSPSIPGPTSSGVLRIGVSSIEAIDIGKMSTPPYSGWIQSGFNTFPDPLSLQPLGGNVGIGTANPGLSAALDVYSTTQGFLPPRMTITNRNNISNPAKGLMIWCDNCGIHGQIQVYNGSIWTDMIGGSAFNAPKLGDRDGGGIIAYIFVPGDAGYIAGETHGIIIGPYDIANNTTEWGCSGINLPGAQGSAVGTGLQNTIDIVNGCSQAGIAARLCFDYVHGGYSDWHLASEQEAYKIYLNQFSSGVTFGNWGYATSTEANDQQSIWINFSNGSVFPFYKNEGGLVRPVRYF